MKTTTNAETATLSIETIDAALNALPGVTTIAKCGPKHRSVFVNGKFVGMIWCDELRGKQTGKIRADRDTGCKLGRAVYRTLLSFAPVLLT